MARLPLTNFAHLAQHDEQLLRLGLLAEKHFADDPNTCLLKLRQLSDLLAQLVAWQLSLGFHRTFKDASFKSGPFIPPASPKDESEELRAEMRELYPGRYVEKAEAQEEAEFEPQEYEDDLVVRLRAAIAAT